MRRPLWIVAAALVVAAAIAVPLWQFVFTSSNGSSLASAPTISFHYPKGWTLEPRSAWAGLGAPASASAVLERTGKTAALVVLRSNPVDVSTPAAVNAEATKLDRQLKAQYADYHLVKSQPITLPHTGKALIFTYLRTQQGVLHTITIVPAGPISYLIETASPPQNKVIGEEIAAILKTAKLVAKN